jgi:hypothetical protein
MSATCTHLGAVAVLELPEAVEGSSPNRHASRHAPATGHAIARSAAPGEEWSWCHEDEIVFVIEAR